MIAQAALRMRDYVLLALFALLMLAPGLSSLPPQDRDESRYAVASNQMAASGDLIDIRFQDEPRYLQPAGIYWLQSAAVTLFSSPEAREIWAYRLPSLAAAIGAVLLTAGVGARLFGRHAGIAAGALFAMSFLLGFEARTAKTDAALLFAITLAQVALLRIYLDPVGPRWRAALFWAALGAGMMLKGPIILMVCGATIAALVLFDRKAAWLKGLHAGWGVPLFLAIALPWYAAITIVSNGDFFAHSLGRNFLGKVGDAQQSHGGPIGYHALLFTLTFWPASIFAAFAAPFVWRNRAEPGIRFLVAWLIPTWIIFEIVATKLPHYVLPTHPALACLAGAALFAGMKDDLGRWRIAGAIYAAIWILLSLVPVGLSAAALWHFEGTVPAAFAAAAVLGFAAACATLWFLVRRQSMRALASAAMAALLAWPVAFAGALPQIETLHLTPRIVAAVKAARTCPDATLTTYPYQEPSLVFLYGSKQTRFIPKPELAADVLAADPDCALALVGATQRDVFLARAATLGLRLEPRARLEGLNYSTGDELDLTLYAVAGSEGSPP